MVFYEKSILLKMR